MKRYIDFNTQKRIEAEKNNHKDETALQKLMDNPIYAQTMEKLRNRIDKKETDYLK